MILNKLIQSYLVTLPKIRHYEGLEKLTWWDYNGYYNYHRTKGHKTSTCIQLKHIIQDFINCGEIEAIKNYGTTNQDHNIFQNPLMDHGKDKASTTGQENKASLAYIKANPNLTINIINIRSP